MVRERPLLAACALVAVSSIALGAASAVAGAMAAAAGTAFEAAPFLLVTAALGPRLGGFAGLAGCGCTRSRMPGALSLAAIAVCAFSFGPLWTLVRTAAALGVLLLKRAPARPPATHARESDVFADLERLGACAFLASLATTALAHLPHTFPAGIVFAAGLGIGALAPCATAGVALAAAFAHADPALAFGLLFTTGLVAVPLPASKRAATANRNAPLAAVALVIALAALAMHGPSGLVHPRLIVPIALGAVVGSCFIGRLRTRTRMSALVPALMLGALAVPARPPTYVADATGLNAAFSGERLAFTGLAHADARGRSTLTRFAITCCRIDATPVSVRVDRGLARFEGRWVAASGTLVASGPDGLVLRTERVRAIPAPADPFIYF